MKKLKLFDLHKSRKYWTLTQYIWRRRNRATRADIVRDLHLSNATVFPAVDHLIRAGIVECVPIKSANIGRRPSGLRICGDQCFATGISISSGKATINIVDAGQNIILEKRITGLSRNGKDCFRRLLAVVQEMLTESKLDVAKMAGIGIVLPGMVDHEHGIVRRSSCFDGIDKVVAGSLFEKKFGCPCMMLSVAPAMALTEKEWGRASEMSTFLYYSGMGIGMFINGKMFMGHQSYGGEIGFMKFDNGNTPDSSGRTGLFHNASPFPKIQGRVKEAVRRGARTVIADWVRRGSVVSMDLILDAAVQGDALCRNLIAEGFNVSAEMIVGLNFLFNPEAVFLQPWTEKIPDISLDIVRRRLELCRLINPDMRVKVLPARYGRDDLACGIAMLPLNHFFARGPEQRQVRKSPYATGKPGRQKGDGPICAARPKSIRRGRTGINNRKKSKTLFSETER